MTKSTITREQLIKKAQEQIEFCRHTKITGEGRAHVNQCAALFEIALAAMDSEPVELPLDYLQGRKDGLEWAARLAEANHPDTGDWLYDDPIELAKAIRKGPDMPPVQPVADSEPVIVVGDDGGDALSYRRLIQSFEPGTKLYLHAQPAPVVPEEMTIRDACKFVQDMRLFDDVSVIVMRTWNACRAAMLQELKKSAGTEAICRSNENVQAVEVQSLTSINPAPDLVSLQKKAESIIGNYPGIPDCWTCNDKANAALMMLDRIETVDPVDDDRIDGIKRIVRELAAAPHDTPALNSIQSVDTVADRWIPVSERMPESNGVYFGWDGKRVLEVNCFFGGFSANQFIHGEITHWMPLPAAPQEVNHG